jgi:hypothetical protein
LPLRALAAVPLIALATLVLGSLAMLACLVDGRGEASRAPRGAGGPRGGARGGGGVEVPGAEQLAERAAG